MKRLNCREIVQTLGRSDGYVRELCRAGYFLSARQDLPRAGWSVAECCIEAEKNTEWPCPTCVDVLNQPEAAVG